MINKLTVKLTPASARKLQRFTDDVVIHEMAKTDLLPVEEVKEYFNDLYDEKIQNTIQQLKDNMNTGTIIISVNNDQYIKGIIQYIKAEHDVVYASNEALGYAMYRLRLGKCKTGIPRPDNRYIYINDSFRNPREPLPTGNEGQVNIIMTSKTGVDEYIREIALENKCNPSDVYDNLDVLNISII